MFKAIALPLLGPWKNTKRTYNGIAIPDAPPRPMSPEERENEAVDLQRKALVDKKYIKQLLFDKTRNLPTPLDVVVNEIRNCCELQSEFLFRIVFEDAVKEVKIWPTYAGGVSCTDLQFETMCHILVQSGFTLEEVFRSKPKKYEVQYRDYRIFHPANQERNLYDFLHQE